MKSSSITRAVTRAASHLLSGCFIAGAWPIVANAQSPTAAVPSGPQMSVLRRYKLTGGDHWDYLTIDASGKRLFITRSDHIEVFDTATEKLIGVIPNMKAVHGIALAEDVNRGYASSGRGNSVLTFDLKSFKVIKETEISGKNPDAILYEPLFKRVFAFNGGSKDSTVLDASSLAVIGTIPLPDKPEFAVSDEAGQIFVNIASETGKIVAIDADKMSVKGTWSLPGCASPSGLAIDKIHHRLFSVCDGGVMAVTDALNGKQIAKVKIGEGPDAAAYDEKRGLVYSSNGEGTLTVIRQDSADRYSVVQTVETMLGARTMALDPTSGRVYLVSSKFGPPPPATAEEPEPHPTPIAGTLEVLVVGAHRPGGTPDPR